MAVPLDANSGASSLSSFDWCLVAVVLISGLMAFRKGLVRVLFSLAGLAAGSLLASWYFASLAVVLHRWVTSLPTAQVLAFLAILFATLILFAVVAGFVRKAVKAVGLGFADRLLGAAFGLARGALVCVGALMAIAAFSPNSALMKNCRLAPYFLAGAHAVSFIVPQPLQRQVADGTEHLAKKTPGVLKPDGVPQ